MRDHARHARIVLGGVPTGQAYAGPNRRYPRGLRPTARSARRGRAACWPCGGVTSPAVTIHRKQVPRRPCSHAAARGCMAAWPAGGRGQEGGAARRRRRRLLAVCRGPSGQTDLAGRGAMAPSRRRSHWRSPHRSLHRARRRGRFWCGTSSGSSVHRRHPAAAGLWRDAVTATATSQPCRLNCRPAAPGLCLGVYDSLDCM